MLIKLRPILKGLFSFVLFVSLTACDFKKDPHEIDVGTISGPETQLMEVAKQVAQREYGLQIKIIPFTDYTMPNRALADGSIDANMFQTLPYLDAAMKAENYNFSVIGKTFLYPMAIYSKKVTQLSEVPKGAIVAIPNDPSNEGRALLLLQKAGLISLDSKKGLLLTPADIIKNPLQLQFKELDAAELPRVLTDVDLGIINTNYAIPAGLLPKKDGLFMEDKHSPYVNVIVVRKQDEKNPKFQKLVKALHSQEVITAAKQLFNGQAIQGW